MQTQRADEAFFYTGLEKIFNQFECLHQYKITVKPQTHKKIVRFAA